MTTQIQEYNATEAALADLRQRMGKAVYEVTTAKGMETAKKDRAEVRGYRVALEKLRVELKAPALERSRLIDAEAKRITAALEAIENPIDEQIKKEEQRKESERLAKIKAEEDRIANIREMIAELFTDKVVTLSGRDSVAIAKAAAEMGDIAITADYMELHAEAEKAKSDAIAKLGELCRAAEAREQEAARLKAEREELDRLRAEDAKRVAEQKAEADRLAGIERNRLAAERAEADRVAAIERKRLADERAEADRIAAVERQHLANERAAFEAEQAAAKAESDRVAAAQKAEREAIEKAKAPPPAPVADFVPTSQQIIEVVAGGFSVTDAKALEWLTALFGRS